MLVIHPSDRTTDFLRTLYEGREDVRLLTGKESRKELGSILFHLRPGEDVKRTLQHPRNRNTTPVYVFLIDNGLI